MGATVQRIINDVRQRGDAAIVSYLKRFDGVVLAPRALRVPRQALHAGLRRIDRRTRAALTSAARNISVFYKRERREAIRSWTLRDRGKTLGQMMVPVDAVGLYVPGGRFSYPSTVLMGAIPARIAGVRRVLVATPPGRITDEVLAACCLAGVDDVYRIGGPAAIAAFAYGTRTVPRVDMVIGPGNRYVTEAKKLVCGDAGIDMLAGPSEVAVIADHTADMGSILAEVAAQLEHDAQSRAFVITWESRVAAALRRHCARAGWRARVRVISAASPEDAVRAANKIGPEHLALLCRRPEQLLRLVRSAGAVFVGHYAPVALGDYCAGPSHILPTGGSSRFRGALSVVDFCKAIHTIHYTHAAFAREAETAMTLARAEGMERHRQAILGRTRRTRG